MDEVHFLCWRRIYLTLLFTVCTAKAAGVYLRRGGYLREAPVWFHGPIGDFIDISFMERVGFGHSFEGIPTEVWQ